VDPIGSGHALLSAMLQTTPQSEAPTEIAKAAAGSPILFAMGAAVYAVSFALPAVADSGDALRGWQCAWIALMWIQEGIRGLGWAIFASGLINPLALAYIMLRVTGRARRLRRGLAILALCLIPLSWVVIAHGLRPEIGHVAWVAGLLMMMAPDALGDAAIKRLYSSFSGRS
jgi:hypothetical protein